MAQRVIQFWVNGIPKGQPRPRAFARNGKARVHDPCTAEGWKGLIALAARPLLPRTPLAGPIWVDRHFYFPRPKRLQRKRDPIDLIPHTAKPDIDNLDKALFDALTTLGVWRDDSLIFGGLGTKHYVALAPSTQRRVPGAEVTIIADPRITIRSIEKIVERMA